MKKSLNNKTVQQLLDAAQAIREHSYSPYSKFKVGAAVLTEDDTIFCGTNVENASYGLTICAERNAMFAAVSAGYRRFKALALVTKKIPGIPFNAPCGACRQVMSEFMDPSAPVYMAVLDGKKRTVYCKTLKELIPFAFTEFSAK
ncbi:MAG: cytidine deaminase [Elusimicrobiaceae bacterium]|nr:cytidine deaminase [Elusimicrobiaceae bacterium]